MSGNAETSLNIINILIKNTEQIKQNEIKTALYYYKIFKNDNETITEYNCNQSYIDELSNYIFNGFIYLVSLEEFNLQKYIGSNFKNEFISLDSDSLSNIEYYITEYFNSNETLLYKLLDLETFKYNIDTNTYNYTLLQKVKFKNLKKTLQTVLFKAFDTYIINFHY